MTWNKCVHWICGVLVKNRFGMCRGDSMKKLEQNGIETRPFFYPMHVMPPYKNEDKFPVAEEIARKGVNLPSSSVLKEEEIKFMCGLGTMFIFKSYRVRRRLA